MQKKTLNNIMNYKEYREYLKSLEWRKKKEQFYGSKLFKKLKKDKKWICFCCEEENKPLDMHHRTYKRLGAENISVDLVPVCRQCHEDIHKAEKDGIQLWEATNHVRRNYRRKKRKIELKERDKLRKKMSKLSNKEFYWLYETKLKKLKGKELELLVDNILNNYI